MGLAKRTDETSHLTLARQGFGTPYYMPYEQAMNAKYARRPQRHIRPGPPPVSSDRGGGSVSGANSLEIVDKKGLGTFTQPAQLNPDVPHALDAILAKMLAADTARPLTRPPASSSSTWSALTWRQHSQFH